MFILYLFFFSTLTQQFLLTSPLRFGSVGFVKLLYLSLYTLTSERKKKWLYSIVSPPIFHKLSLSVAELKMFCGDDGSFFCTSPFLSHRWRPKALCKKWRKILRHYFSGTTWLMSLCILSSQLTTLYCNLCLLFLYILIYWYDIDP